MEIILYHQTNDDCETSPGRYYPTNVNYIILYNFINIVRQMNH